MLEPITIDVVDAHYRDMDFLDRLHVVACLLHPFYDVTKGDAAFWAVAEKGEVLDDGYRFLSRIVAAIDDAVECHRGLREYQADVMAVLVPMRYTLHSLSAAWRLRDDVDQPLPDDAADILDFAYKAVREAARTFHDEALGWYTTHAEEGAP